MPGHVGFLVDKVALGQVLPEYFRFPCHFLFHRMSPFIIIVYHPVLVQ
jgi:hypothetical protein